MSEASIAENKCFFSLGSLQPIGPGHIHNDRTLPTGSHCSTAEIFVRSITGLFCQIGGRPTSWVSLFLLLCYFLINLLHLKLIMLLRKPNHVLQMSPLLHYLLFIHFVYSSFAYTLCYFHIIKCVSSQHWLGRPFQHLDCTCNILLFW